MWFIAPRRCQVVSADCIQRRQHRFSDRNCVFNNPFSWQMNRCWVCSPIMQSWLLFRGGHPFEDDLKVINFSDPDPKILDETITNTCFSPSRCSANEQQLPFSVWR